MKNRWTMHTVGLVVVVLGGVLLGAVSHVWAGPFPGDGVDGPALSYWDNGDGTTTDLNTKLTWEQKLPATAAACLATPPHVRCVDNTYTWGEAFTAFLDVLNNTCDADGTTPCQRHKDCKGKGSGKCGFDGHRDWRLPNVRELQSLVHYAYGNPAIDPTFLGPTAVDAYWSSTERWALPDYAWYVYFFNGEVNGTTKDHAYRVRAVRGGPR